MIKIQSQKFNHTAEHYEFKLENGDTVLIHETNLDDAFRWHDSVNNKAYFPIFSEVEYNDDPREIIGFELMGK